MSLFVIDLCDRALCFARDGRLLSVAPSSVSDPNRPRRMSSRHLFSSLAGGTDSFATEQLVESELAARLAEHPVQHADTVWVVVPSGAQPSGLTTLLGIARRISLPVTGFVDTAAVAAAGVLRTRPGQEPGVCAPARDTVTSAPGRLGDPSEAIVLELGLHHAAATSVDLTGRQARRRRTVLYEQGGLMEVYQSWLDLISDSMVKRTRFDPLHDATTERRLLDSLPGLLAEAASAAGTTTVVMPEKGLRADITRDQFARAADRFYRHLIGLLHQLRPAGAAISVIAPEVIGAFPGLRGLLDQLSGCELTLLPDGWLAAAASLLDLPEISGTDVRLLRRIRRPDRAPAPEWRQLQDRVSPPDGVPPDPQHGCVAELVHERLGPARTGPVPSHVLWEGRAYAVGADPLIVGRGLAASTRHLILPEGLAGVSRRHCTFVHDGAGLVLLDHSSFGTFVNGERVAERVRLYCGDRVRLGDPGIELALIGLSEPPGRAEPV
jgi:hypothetical protein